MTDQTRTLLEQAATTLEEAVDHLPKPNSTEAMLLSSEIRDELAKPVESDAPIRSYRLTLQLDADALGDLASAMMNLSLRADRGELTRGVSGGPDSGYIYENYWAGEVSAPAVDRAVAIVRKVEAVKAEGGAA